MEKICRVCKQSKTVEEFTKNKQSKDKLHYVCKQCMSDYYQANKEKRKAYSHNYYHKVVKKNEN